MLRLPAGRLAIAAVAIAATVAGGALAATRLAGAADPQRTSAQRADTALPGISAAALARFDVTLSDPAGHGTARLTSARARTVALPLGEGPQSDGWSIAGSPLLAFVDYRAGASVSRTCLCWAVELDSARAIPCDAQAGTATAGASRLCDNHHLVELIDATTGGHWLSFSGHGLG